MEDPRRQYPLSMIMRDKARARTQTVSYRIFWPNPRTSPMALEQAFAAYFQQKAVTSVLEGGEDVEIASTLEQRMESVLQARDRHEIQQVQRACLRVLELKLIEVKHSYSSYTTEHWERAPLDR